MRQALACSFCMVAFVYAVKRKPIKFFLFNYLAISMHITAILFIMVYFLNYLGKSRKINVAIFCLFGFAMYEFDNIYSSISSISNEANTYSTLIQNNGTTGFLNIIVSILISCGFLLLCRSFEKKSYFLNNENNRIIYLSQYSTIISIGFYFLALLFSQISRISLYFLIGYFHIASFVFYSMDGKVKTLFMKIGLVFFMISYFVIVQIIRPEWTSIVPYVWM